MFLAPVQVASVPRQDGAGDALRQLRRGLVQPGEEPAPSSMVWLPWDDLSSSPGSHWRDHPDSDLHRSYLK